MVGDKALRGSITQKPKIRSFDNVRREPFAATMLLRFLRVIEICFFTFTFTFF